VAVSAVRLKRPFTIRALTTLALSAAATFGILAVSGSVVHATPTPGEVEAQIDAKWNQLEPIIEKYNAVNAQLTAAQKQVDKLKAQIQPLQLQVDLAMARVGAVSAGLYVNGGPAARLDNLLQAGSPEMFASQYALLNEMASQQASTVAAAKGMRDEYDKQKQPIDTQVADLKKQFDALAAQKKSIDAQIADLNKLRLTAYGTTTGTGNIRPVACPQVYTGDAGSKAAAKACSLIGKPYIWAAAGPNGYDCSGLTLTAWSSVGVSLPHNAYQQKQVTTRISRADLRPGDLIFMYSDVHHVTIYVGNGWDVAAPTFGEPVQMQQPFASGRIGVINGYGRPHG